MTTAAPAPDDAPRSKDLTRRSLLLRLKDTEDQESWREFFELYWKLIYNLALYEGLQPAEADEVVQETVLMMVKNLPTFDYDPRRGKFRSWLKTTARWKIADQFRKRLPNTIPSNRDPKLPDPLQSMPDPSSYISEERWDKEWRNYIKDLALNRVRKRVNPKQFQMFDLHTLQGIPMDDIVKMLEVNRNMVYLANHRIKALLIEEIGKLRESN